MPCAFHAERPYPFRRFDNGCQFEDHEAFLIEVDGESWCKFHAPLKDRHAFPTQKGEWPGGSIEQLDERINVLIDNARENKETCDLTGVVFPDNADFKGKHFGEVCFLKAQFSGGDADFSGARFDRGLVIFRESKFSHGNVNFSNVHFNGGDVFFNEATFSGGYANFSGAEFTKGIVSFSGATFSGGSALFFETTFRVGLVNFHGAKFISNKGDNFSGARFSGGAVDFGEARFSSLANFTAPEGEDDKYMERRIFRLADFSRAQFEGISEGDDFKGVNFENRIFLRQTSFKDCFFASAPQFHGCALHQNTVFPGEENFKDTKSDGAASAYRTLKLAMENARSRNEEAMFYALEQKSLRNRDDTPNLVMLASYLYEMFSDYGQSFGLPLFWMLFVSFVFSQFYGDMAGAAETSCLQKMGNVGFAVQQIFRPFEIWRLSAGGISCGVGIKLI